MRRGTPEILTILRALSGRAESADGPRASDESADSPDVMTPDPVRQPGPAMPASPPSGGGTLMPASHAPWISPGSGSAGQSNGPFPAATVSQGAQNRAETFRLPLAKSELTSCLHLRYAENAKRKTFRFLDVHRAPGPCPRRIKKAEAGGLRRYGAPASRIGSPKAMS